MAKGVFFYFFIMKKKLFLIIWVCCAIVLHGQSKRDQNWILGKTNNAAGDLSNGYYGGMQFKFENGTVKIDTIDIRTTTPTGVANDENGNLLFYTNGCSIFNRQHEIMENGTDITGGETLWCGYIYQPGNVFVKSGTVVLPLPDSDTRYMVVNLALVNTIEFGPYYGKIVCAEVDMSANGGLGKVVQSNTTIVEDSLVDALSAVRHANGRDWWIMVPRGTDRAFWQILVTPQGLQPAVLQTSQPPYTPFTLQTIKDIDVWPYEYVTLNEYQYEGGGIQASFSPDGTKYCRIVKEQEVEVYDFDRCSGVLSLRRLVPVHSFEYPDSLTYTSASGLAISPNSRYLYFNNNEELFQLDISDDSLASSVPILIDTYDGFFNDFHVFAANFFQMRNAPDGKIYMGCGNGTRVLHVIEQPNEPGLACSFKQHGLVLPRWHIWIINYFPNFNLGAAIGSSCDSLSVGTEQATDQWAKTTVRPNPADGYIDLQFGDIFTGGIEVYTASGVFVQSKQYSAALTAHISVADLPNGMYFLRCVEDDGKRYHIYRVVVTH